HSRQGSGERRTTGANTILEESLNLACANAAHDKRVVAVNVETNFDASAGEFDVFPQEITRVLLNLISNSFYALGERHRHERNGNYQPSVKASTKGRGTSVEIAIRDNGTGIAPDVREKMFNPFFTTKPTGEGTGLGLSISHDIIVKQHAGHIEVDT